MTTYLQIVDLWNAANALRRSLDLTAAAALVNNISVFLQQHPAAAPPVVAYLLDAQVKLAPGNFSADNVDRVINNLVSAGSISDSETFIDFLPPDEDFV